MTANNEWVHIFIPSYHRADNLKTVRYFIEIGYPAEYLHVFIDDEADDRVLYKLACEEYGCQLHVFDMVEARRRYDYVHRPSPARRSAGQARNMFYDVARELGIDFYCIQDDDTSNYQLRPFGVYTRIVRRAEIMQSIFSAVRDFMQRHHIGLFGLSQTGDIYSNEFDAAMFRPKVMNTTFIDIRYIYRGERGVQDDDTSQFVGVMNEGLFCGSLASGVVLSQTASATSPGGLTDLYNELKLLNKSVVVPIQFPSCSWAERQKKNGNRIHHRINYRYLFPRIMRAPEGRRGNIAWDSYSEDYPFTNEPKRLWQTTKI